MGRGKPLEAREKSSSRQDSWSPARAMTAKEIHGDMGVEEYVDRIAEEMHERVEFQRRLFKQLLAGGGNALDRPAYCPLVDCPRLSRLQAALRETIEVFEETRSSFKSRRLEVMRKRLIDILAGS